MAETSSTTSRSRSRASASSTISSLPTSTVSITSSFSPPPPLPTTSFGVGGNGNGNGNGFNGGSSIASSASLYLYTFLATLVLLLSVSAAIVVRSFLLRRRHRQMIEEAIRNGTWIPPAPGGRGGPRVDLSKKPLLWEAYLDLHHSQNQNQAHQQSSMILDERDWESMKPVMATYVNEPVAKKAQNGSGGVPGGGGGGGGGDDSSRDGGDGQGRNGRRGVAARLLEVFTGRARGVSSNSPSEPTLPLTHPVSNGTGNNTRQGSAVNLSTPAQDVPMSEITPPEPPRVRVAVLIAMPRPHSTSASSNSSSSSSSSSSSAPPQIPANNTSEDEEELPHIEMGVAELNVSDSHLSGMGTDDMRMGDKGKVRESMTSGISV